LLKTKTMKIIKILFRKPQFLVIFILLALLFIFECIIVLVSAPFELMLKTTEYTIKQLLTLID